MAKLLIIGNTVQTITADDMPDGERSLTIRSGSRKRVLHLYHDQESCQLCMDLEHPSLSVLSPSVLPSERLDQILQCLLAVMILFMMFSCYRCIDMNTQLLSHSHCIACKRQTLEEMKSKNLSLESSIKTSISVDDIYRISTQELGMVPSEPSETIFYEKTGVEYTRQYDAIPSALYAKG